MGWVKSHTGHTSQTKVSFVVTVISLLLVGILAISRLSPNVYASVDPGLDSGNAVVDRTSVPGQTILLYKTAGNSTFKAPAGVTNVRVLVVGAGGGGGAGELNNAGDGGGAGGAGEYLHQTSFSVTPGTAVGVTVGAGGAGSTTKLPDGGGPAGDGASGSNSTFSSLTARGGGGGGGNDFAGVSGGSGGGAGGRCTSGSLSGGASTAVSPGVGNAGGGSSGGSCSPRGAAGGGGAGAAGTSGSGGSGGTGGAGLQNDITGTNTFYAAGGGGGGGSNSGTGASGGSSIGGTGGNASGGSGTNGAINTGSGAGGGGSSASSSGGNGGTGGSGVVIVRFATQNVPDPGGVAGTVMWYKADSAGNTNAQWNDVSGFSRNLTQPTASKQPALTSNSINFNPAYVFDGTDDVFSLPSGIAGNESMSAFFGALSTSEVGGDRYFNEFGDDRPSITLYNGKPRLYVRDTSSVDNVYSTIAALQPNIYSFVSPNGGGQKIIGVDNKEETWSITGNYTTSSGASGNTFGGRNVSAGTSWIGPIGEAIYFNRVLTQQERQRVNSYLAIKYGVTLNQGTSGTAYLASNNATVWPADSTFKNNIAGIGRDDSSTLNQKQSKSTASGNLVTIGHGAVAATNQANTNNFTSDRTFLMWGHNGATTDQATNVSGTSYARMGRIWKAVVTSTVGQLKVRIPTSIISRSSAMMFVSNSTTFDASSQAINMTTVGSEYEATVTLAAGTHYFSFGSPAGSDIQFVSKTATDIGGTPITNSNYTPGEPIEYVLSVKNNGPDSSGTITVTDTLPTDFVPVSATGGGWTCNVSGQTVTCTRSTLNAGVTAPSIIIDATIASSVTGTKINTAQAAAANDPNPNNNSASITLNAAPRADLSITKEDVSAPVAGSNFDYKFTVTNNGPSDTPSFTIADALPADLTYVSATPNICGGSSGQNVTCASATALADGQSQVVTVTVHVDAGYGGSGLVNTGTVGVPSGVTDPNTANNSSTNNTSVNTSADLGISKSHTGNFVAGDSNDFTISVTNNGPSTVPANSITVTDTIPDKLAYSGFSGTNWSCSETGGTVTCGYSGTIAPLETRSFILTVDAESTATGTADNIASVSSTIPDSNLSNNSSTDTVNFIAEADLAITKTHVDTTFTAGQQEQYNFAVTNNGPSADSPSFTVTDTLPASLTFVSASGDATCAAAGQVVTCTGGAVAVGETLNFTMVVAVGGSATGTISNTATVATPAGTTDPVSGNNSSTDTVNVTPNADLSITKTHATDLIAGDSESYTIVVTNNGPSNVSSFTITDTLDPNFTYTGATGATCNAAGQTVTCTGGALANGNTANITITATLASTATPGSTIANTAVVAVPAGVNDPNNSNNSSTVSNTVDTSADLAITKTHTGNFTAGANTNTFTLTVTNNGPSDAAELTITDVLPAEFTYVDATGPDADCENAGQTVTCTVGPELGAGETTDITITVAVGADITGGTVINNTASVSSTTADPNTGNNSDTDAVTIDSSADLSIIKSLSSPDFTAGNNENYQFKVANAGPSDADAFTVSDTLDSNLTYVSSSPNICSAAGQVVTCNGGALEAGKDTAITITVSVNPALAVGTTITNTGTVATVAPTTDPNSANNSSTVTSTVVAVTDLSIAKNHTGTFIAGESGQYTITVTNNGPSATPTSDITVTDTLPTGMTYDSFSGAGWNCNVAAQTVTCVYAPVLTVSATTPTLTLTADIAPDKQGQVTNTATVSSTTDDPNTSNDTDSDTTMIGAEADLTATKDAQGALVAGEPVTYRFKITNNGGPSVANNVTIEDDLSNKFTYQSFSGVVGSWNCSNASQTVTCTLGSPLAVGNSAVVDVTVLVAQDAPDPVENSATVSFNGTDPTPPNPSTSDPVSYSADLEVTITHEQKTYHSGDVINYIYTVKNHGSSAAKDVVLTDTLPNGLTITNISATEPGGSSILAMIDNALFPRVSAASNPFSCSLSGQQLTCNADTVFVGTYTLYVTGKISNTFTGRLTNSLHITSSTPDPNPLNNNATDIVQEVLPGNGLAGTGQNVALWITGAGSILALTTILVWYGWKKQRYTLNNPFGRE